MVDAGTEELIELLADVSPNAFSSWGAGERTTSECEELVAYAKSLQVIQISDMCAFFRSKTTSWSNLCPAGVEPTRFLALSAALMADEDVTISGHAVAAHLAAMRCSGAARFGLFHPIANHQLARALRTVLSSPPAASDGHKTAVTSGRAAGTKSSRGAGGRKSMPKRAARTASYAADDGSDDESDDDDEPERVQSKRGARDASASHGEWGSTAQLQRAVLEAATALLSTVALAEHTELLGQLVRALSEAAASAAAHCDAETLRMLYAALERCLLPHHGDVGRTAPLVFRALVHTLSLAGEGTAPSKGAIAAMNAAKAWVAQVCGGESSEGEAPREALHDAVQALLQRVAASTPDRAEPRAIVCAAVSELLGALPAPIYARFAVFVWRLGHTAKVSSRSFAVEMAGAALEAAADANAKTSLIRAEGASQVLWRLLLQRTADKAAGVRARALSSLASVLSAMHAQSSRALLKQVQEPLSLPADADADADAGTPTQPAERSPAPPSSPRSATRAPTPGSGGMRASGGMAARPPASLLSAASSMDASLPTLGASLQSRCADEKPLVRKAALQAMEAWSLASGLSLSAAQVELLLQRCADASAAIRKQASRSLCTLLEREPQCASLRRAWLGGVLPLVKDSETSVCDAAIEAVNEAVLQPLARCHKQPDKARRLPLWLLLEQLLSHQLPYVEHALGVLARQKQLPPHLATVTQSLLMDAEATGEQAPTSGQPPQQKTASEAAARSTLWVLLQQLAAVPALRSDAIDAEAVASAWRCARGSEASAALRVLLTLARRGGVPAALSAQLRTQAEAKLRAMGSAPAEVALLVQTCAALGGVDGGSDAWQHTLMCECTQLLRDARTADTRAVQQALVIVGELALAVSTQAGAKNGAKSGAESGVPSELVGAVRSIVREGADGDGPSPLAPVAYVTLGKLCMGDADLAKQMLPMLLTELATNGQPAVRNNVLVALYDLAKRHTALLDRHVPTMALAICDASPLVRQQALVLMTQLLLEDFVKWRPTLFRVFCVALVDDDETQRASAHSCLFELLLPRSPLLALNSFLPLLFSLNGCDEHAQHSSPLSAAERAAVQMEGERRQKKRLAAMRALLGHMSEEHRLQVTAKLCHEVLAALPDGQLTLEKSHSVLSDALQLLACHEVKVSASTAADEGGDEPEQSAVAAAKGKVLSAVARKAVVEAIVPVVIELKRFLERKHSPLLRDVFLFLRELLKDHKQHLQDILSRDRQLASEIEYDMRQLAAQAPRPRAAQALSPLVSANSPRVRAGAVVSTPVRPSARKSPSMLGTAPMRVPTPDRLGHALSVPKIRASRSAASLGSEDARARALGAQSRSKALTPGGEVHLQSPFKAPLPPRQWAVSAVAGCLPCPFSSHASLCPEHPLQLSLFARRLLETTVESTPRYLASSLAALAELPSRSMEFNDSHPRSPPAAMIERFVSRSAFLAALPQRQEKLVKSVLEVAPRLYG